MNKETPSLSPLLAENEAPLCMDVAPSEHEEAPSAEETLPLLPGVLPDPEHVVLFVGGGHMSQEAAKLAHYAGFTVDVLDEREEYAINTRFPHARQVLLCQDYATLTTSYALESRHYVVILTHSYESDLSVLMQALDSPVRYIGLAATKRKKENIFAELRGCGVPDAELVCVRCPIGLAIGAESPQEMAIAIAGELIAAKTGCLPRPRPRRHTG